MLGLGCTALMSCQLGTGIWVGILAFISGLFGLLAVKNPDYQSILIAYFVSCLISCFSAIILIYIAGVQVVLDVWEFDKSEQELREAGKETINKTKGIGDKYSTAWVTAEVTLNGLLVALSFAYGKWTYSAAFRRKQHPSMTLMSFKSYA